MFRTKKPVITSIHISGIEIEVHKKSIKNMNMRIYPSMRKVRISAPHHLSTKHIEQFAKSKLHWIEKHLATFKKKAQKPDLKYVSGEKHFVWGKECELYLEYSKKRAKVEILNCDVLKMTVKPNSNIKKRASILKEWYRKELKREIPKLIAKWEKPMGVSVQELGVKQMKTRWGTCNIKAHRIWLNLELAKKSPDCLEYVVVHEMVHLLERLHNTRFHAFMDHFLPEWRQIKHKLNGKVD